MKPAERVATHAVLVAGGLLFLLPLLWMLGTSFKVPREMATKDVEFLPESPSPENFSPYIDLREFDEPERPDGVREEVWRRAVPELDAFLNATLDKWEPQTLGGPRNNPPPAKVDVRRYRAEMRQGLYELLSQRLSDSARASGTEALVENAREIVDERALRETFDACYRRFCLGEVRIRTNDYLTYSLYTGREWVHARGSGALQHRADAAPECEEVRYKFDRYSADFAARFWTPRLPVEPAGIDRVFVSYRGDASWALVKFTVTRDGKYYETRSLMNLYERDWIEQELRWPEDAKDPLEKKLYRVLHEVGPVEIETEPEDFAVYMEIRKANILQAWFAKTTRAYRQAFREVPFARFMMTSFAVAILNIVLAIFSCTLVGYAFARLEWPGRDLCFFLVLATMMIPPQVTMIPQFIVVKWLGWYNTLIPLWILSAFGIPFFIFLVRQFFKNIPGDLEDAARIDGCGFMRIYWHVMMPLIKPVIATIAIFTFMGTWNNFLMPLIYLNDERLFPLALGLFKFNLTAGGDVSLMMAGSFIMTMPVLALFALLQRYFIQGITLTGTKG